MILTRLNAFQFIREQFLNAYSNPACYSDDEKALISYGLNRVTGQVPSFTVEDLRVINCLSFRQYLDMMTGFGPEPTAGALEYHQGKFAKKNRDLFGWLADLDTGNQRLVFEYVNK